MTGPFSGGASPKRRRASDSRRSGEVKVAHSICSSRFSCSKRACNLVAVASTYPVFTTCRRNHTCTRTTPTRSSASSATQAGWRRLSLGSRRGARSRLTPGIRRAGALAARVTSLDPFHGAQFSRTRARIRVDLGSRRHHGFFGQQLHFLTPTALTPQASRRAKTIAAPLAESRFHHAVFQRVKGNNGHSPLRSKRFIAGFQKALEMVQLSIDRHSERLKHLCCRMRSAATATLYLVDDLNEIGSSFQRPDLSFSHDGLRNAPGLRLFAVIPKDLL